MIVGVLSDTHGTLSKRALRALRGVDHILHAGDVGDPAILAALEKVAPLTAVRGNTDGGDWARALPPTDMIELKGKLLYLLHDLYLLDLDPLTAGVHVVISGHTHQGAISEDKGILYFNPGSASQGRNGVPPSVGRITISRTGLHPQIIQLD